MEDSRRHVKAILDAVYGDPVASLRLAPDGRSSFTYLVDFDAPRDKVVCKIGGQSVYTDEVVEPLVIERIGHRTSIPVPQVLETGTLPNRRHPDNRWALYSHLDGFTPREFDLLPIETRERILTEVGAYLAELHTTCTYEHFGAFGRDGEELQLKKVGLAEMVFWGHRLTDVLGQVEEGEQSPVLSHGDLFPGNLLIGDEGSILGIIDWANAHVTTPGDSLARAELRFIDWFRPEPTDRTTLKVALREGYQRHCPLPEGFATRGWLYKLIWLAQSGVWALGHLATPHGRRQLQRTLRG